MQARKSDKIAKDINASKSRNNKNPNFVVPGTDQQFHLKKIGVTLKKS